MCFHESEYSHLSPRTLGKLAKLVADKVSAGEKDPIRIRDEALADLRLKGSQARRRRRRAPVRRLGRPKNSLAFAELAWTGI